MAASGNVLIMAFVGGVGHFFGPVIGAALVSFLQSALSSYTKAWLLYFGLFFMVMILFAPGGIASLIALHGPPLRHRLAAAACSRATCWRARRWRCCWPASSRLVEMTYHLEIGRGARGDRSRCSA